MAEHSAGEFHLIEKYLRPLSGGASGAFSLADDAAEMTDGARVIAKDMLIEGVHFLSKDPLDLVARKALRTNLSDLAAMGAKPLEYLMACAWPAKTTEKQIRQFTEGLAEDQKEFRISLIGGDTTRHRNKTAPLVISLTVIGTAPKAGLIMRNGAKAGDDVYVSGAIGDAGLGLLAASGEIKFSAKVKACLIERYRLPIPRIGLGTALAGVASAAIDVSDGLIADAYHLAAASKLRLDLHTERMPVSPEAGDWLSSEDDSNSAIARLATFGDDYELLFTAPSTSRRAVEMAARLTHTPVTRIGSAARGEGVRLLDNEGDPISLNAEGFKHFA